LFERVGPASADERAALAAFQAACTILHLAAGEAVRRDQDTEGSDLWLVLAGVLAAGGEQFEPGDWVGAYEADNRVLAGATMVATGPATVMHVPARARRDLAARSPALWQRVLGVVDDPVVSLHLATTPLFAGIPVEHLAQLDAAENWVAVTAGDVLVARDAAPDALHVVVHGRLRAEADGPSGRAELLERGGVVGLGPLLLDDDHSPTVRAVRDSALARIPGADFRDLLEREPAFGRNLSRHLAQQLATKTVRANPRPVTIALVPIDGRPLDAATVPALAAALEAVAQPLPGHNRVTVVDAARVADEVGDLDADRLTPWLSRHEARSAFVLFVADAQATDWSNVAMRQADVVVLLARPATAQPGRTWVDTLLDERHSPARRVLALLHGTDSIAPGTAAWLAGRTVASHHHVRAGNAADVARLARWLGGVAVGVTLSGGGARGFAHIGALAALAECGVPVDIVGGASMGSVIAAQHALGLTTQHMIEVDGREFPACSVWGDLTPPVVALLRGGSTVTMLKKMFGEVLIEDLPVPYFCVSTNLSEAETVVHDRGPVWLWVRASSSVPGIGPPVAFGRDLLVDGGVVNNLPADVMRARCPGPVIGVDVAAKSELHTTAADYTAETSGWRQLAALARRRKNKGPVAVPTLMQILGRTTMLSSIHNRERVQRYCDLYVNPPVQDIGPLQWAKIQEAVDIGYRATKEQATAWVAAGGLRR
jgi:NTE family protein